MRAFTCGHCSHLLFFENSLCLRCDATQGFLPSKLDLVPVGPDGFADRESCANAAIARCNWLVEDEILEVCAELPA